MTEKARRIFDMKLRLMRRRLRAELAESAAAGPPADEVAATVQRKRSAVTLCDGVGEAHVHNGRNHADEDEDDDEEEEVDNGHVYCIHRRLHGYCNPADERAIRACIAGDSPTASFHEALGDCGFHAMYGFCRRHAPLDGDCGCKDYFDDCEDDEEEEEEEGEDDEEEDESKTKTATTNM